MLRKICLWRCPGLTRASIPDRFGHSGAGSRTIGGDLALLAYPLDMELVEAREEARNLQANSKDYAVLCIVVASTNRERTTMKRIFTAAIAVAAIALAGAIPAKATTFPSLTTIYVASGAVDTTHRTRHRD